MKNEVKLKLSFNNAHLTVIDVVFGWKICSSCQFWFIILNKLCKKKFFKTHLTSSSLFIDLDLQLGFELDIELGEAKKNEDGFKENGWFAVKLVDV